MIQVVLVEDQEIVRRGLKTLLETKPDLKVVGEAGNGQEAVELVETLHANELAPDVILMDIRMPIMDGVTATQQICQKFPGTKIMVLTTFDDTQYIAEALRFGAKGYLLKDTASEELAEAVRSIHRGYTQFGPGILEKMIVGVPSEEPNQLAEIPPSLTELTPRERQVLLMIAKGASNREIAQALFLSEGTVRNHISHILTRLEVRDRTQAAIVANSCLSWLESNAG
ncbi:MAG: response regulator transcription factor [Leptolyngbyaceae cyanobacterium RU_5_1]|nr:response regulator transcription factor [Leptolyngbyaceae cyanobacterium RU_5_1]